MRKFKLILGIVLLGLVPLLVGGIIGGMSRNGTLIGGIMGGFYVDLFFALVILGVNLVCDNL